MNRYQQCIALLLFVEERKEVTLKAVLEHLYPKDERISFNDFEMTLGLISGDGAILVYAISSKKPIRLTKGCLDAPNDYVVVFHGLNKYENNAVCHTQPNFLYGDEAEISEQHNLVDVNLRDFTALFGEKEGANTLYERMRAFTNYFANALCNKNYELIVSLVSKNVNSKYNVDYFTKFIKKKEESVDEIKFYDIVEVVEIYNGEITDPDVDLMRLPKDGGECERIGISKFRLVYGHTPNGVAIFWQDVRIEILEEEGRFKVFDMRCVN